LLLKLFHAFRVSSVALANSLLVRVLYKLGGGCMTVRGAGVRVWLVAHAWVAVVLVQGMWWIDHMVI
jgi:hypothetical protein